MQLIVERNTDPCHNLAQEEALLNGVKEEIIYLWRNRPSVIVGRHQNTLAEIDEKAVEKHGVNVVRRLTGGGAVFHDLGNVNFSFLFAGEDVEKEAAKGCLLLLDFLTSLGVDPQLTGRNDICIKMTDGTLAKIAGTAMTERDGRGIFHGCVLFDCDLHVMGEVLTPPAAKLAAKGTASVRSRVVNLKTLTPYLQQLSRDAFFEIWAAYMSERCTCFHEVTEEEKELTEKLMEERYRSWHWNYGRNPSGTLVNSYRFPIGTVSLTLELSKGRIANCSFSGDYINRFDLDELTTRLTDIPFDRKSLTAALETIDLHKYFGIDDRALILDYMTGRYIEHEKD